MGYEFFDRQYRLAAGPAGGTGFEVGEATEEQPVPLHISFSFQKTDLETQNTGKIEIWNLNEDELSVLEEEDCVVSLRAGYGDSLSLIFAGIVSFVSTTMDNADRKTEIEVVDNLIEIRDTYLSVSYSGSVSWETILNDTAAAMGVAISYSSGASFTTVSNFSYVGKARNILTKACDSCGLTWSIQNGVLQVKKSGESMFDEVYVLSAETGLLGIPSRVVVTQDEDTEENILGWDVDYFLNGAINIDDYVYLGSSAVTGYFYVYSIDIAGDNQASDWTCSARLLEED